MHFDWRGTPLEVGSLVVWAVSHSSSTTVTEGRVIEIIEHTTNDTLDENYHRAKTFCQTCQWLKEDSGGSRHLYCVGFDLRAECTRQPGRSSWATAPIGKKVSLTRADRVTVVA